MAELAVDLAFRPDAPEDLPPIVEPGADPPEEAIRPTPPALPGKRLRALKDERLCHHLSP
jgi:hypothetical protein